MRSLKPAALCTLLAAPLLGCSVTGNWKLDSLEPADVGAFKFGSLQLADDGAYVGTVDYGHGPREVRGQYTFENGKLSFKDESGRDAVYDAALCGFLCNEMKVSGELEGRPWTAVMKRN